MAKKARTLSRCHLRKRENYHTRPSMSRPTKFVCSIVNGKTLCAQTKKHFYCSVGHPHQLKHAKAATNETDNPIVLNGGCVLWIERAIEREIRIEIHREWKRVNESGGGRESESEREGEKARKHAKNINKERWVSIGLNAVTTYSIKWHWLHRTSYLFMFTNYLG